MNRREMIAASAVALAGAAIPECSACAETPGPSSLQVEIGYGPAICEFEIPAGAMVTLDGTWALARSVTGRLMRGPLSYRGNGKWYVGPFEPVAG